MDGPTGPFVGKAAAANGTTATAPTLLIALGDATMTADDAAAERTTIAVSLAIRLLPGAHLSP